MGITTNSRRFKNKLTIAIFLANMMDHFDLSFMFQCYTDNEWIWYFSLHVCLVSVSPVEPVISIYLLCVCVCSVVSNSLQPHGLYLARLLCLWNFTGKNTGADCYCLFQGSSQPKDQTCISCISCIGRQIL